MRELLQTELDDFRQMLEDRRAELVAVTATGNQSAETVELDQSRVGRLSRMDAMQAQAMSIESNRRREIELRRIDLALVRLDAGEYGICLNCGEDIVLDRLRADSATPVCINCAS